VDTAGAISSRFTVTRLALMGPFALAMKKKKDQRELFLYIEAPTGQHMAPCRPDDAVRVRVFASQITNAARSAELTGDRSERLENLRLRYENLDAPDCAWRLALAELRALEQSMREDQRLPEKYTPRDDPTPLPPW
jgi:hypothetical protein